MLTAYLPEPSAKCSPCMSDSPELREFKELEQKMQYEDPSRKYSESARRYPLRVCERSSQTVLLSNEVTKTTEIKDLENQLSKVINLWRRSKSQLLKLEEEHARVKTENENLKIELKRLAYPPKENPAPKPYLPVPRESDWRCSTPIEQSRKRGSSPSPEIIPGFKIVKDIQKFESERIRNYSISSLKTEGSAPEDNRKTGDNGHSFFSLANSVYEGRERSSKPPVHPQSQVQVTPLRSRMGSSPIITNEEIISVREMSKSVSPCTSSRRHPSPVTSKPFTSSPHPLPVTPRSTMRPAFGPSPLMAPNFIASPSIFRSPQQVTTRYLMDLNCMRTCA